MISIKSTVFFVFALFVTVTTTGYVSGTAYADSATPAISDDVFDRRIHNYILFHPAAPVSGPTL